MIRRLSGWLRAQLEIRGSTRGLAISRLMLLGIVMYRVLVPMHAAWVVPPAAKLISILLVLAAFLAFVGYRTRFTIALVVVLFGVVHLHFGLIEGDGKLARGVQLFQALIALSLTPAGKSFSIDRWLEVRRARARGLDPPPEEGPLWGVWLFAIALSCLYFWAAVDKLDPAWFAGERLDRLWIFGYGSSDAFGRYPAILRLGASVSAYAVTGIELGLAIGLLIPRARPYMPILGLLLHMGIWAFLGVWPFTISCLACYPAIASPRAVHRFFDGLRAPPERDLPSSSRAPVVALRVLGFLLFLTWCSQGPARRMLETRETPHKKLARDVLGTPWAANILKTDSVPACDITYYRRVDGEDRRIRHWRQFPYDPRKHQSISLRRVTRHKLPSHTRALCQKLQRRHRRAHIDIRGVIRCPTDGAWELVEDGARNLCEKPDPNARRRSQRASAREKTPE